MHAIRQKVHAIEQSVAQGNVATDTEYKVTQEHFDLALKDLLGERNNNNNNNNDESATTAAVDKVELPNFEWSGGFSFGV